MYREIEPVLKKWKEKENRLPIILRGARQVGKSFVIEKFGRENFESVITCNFEFQPELAACFGALDPIAICAKLEIAFKTRIVPGKTLLFFDEIQNCPEAILSLRYFKEKHPSLHVIAAGSLLEFALHEERFSFPVGRVQFLYLRPLSFYEYLISRSEEPLIDYLRKVNVKGAIESFIHEQALKSFREYFMIGGMPSVVKCFLETHSFLECQAVLTGLLETYRSDFPKYATKAQYKYLQNCFDRIPGLVMRQFKYTHISSEHRSHDLKIAIEQLGWAGLVQKVLATNASGLPLQVHAKENRFKLLFLDGGLVNCANKLDLQTAWDIDLIQVNSGTQAEQFVGQELLAYSDPYSNSQLYYWERDKRGSSAEVDFVIQSGGHILPVEVKSGTTGSLKSLAQFMSEKKSSIGIRISQHPLSFHDNILSVPFYMIKELPRLVRELSPS
jgi:hypothetical protein